MAELDIDPRELVGLSRSELIDRVRMREIYNIRESKERCEESLTEFIKQAWPVIEPANAYAHNWHVTFICEHLTAVTYGELNRLLINVPPGPGWVENLVTTDKGRVRLGDLCVGDNVLTHKGQYRPVTACYSKGELPTLRIVTKGGRQTVATPDHNFLTPNGWVAARDLMVGDTLAFVTPQEDVLTAAISFQEARLLGYLIGDGSLTNAMVCFTNKDEDIVADFEQCARDLGFTTAKTWRKTHWSVRLRGGKSVSDWLDSYGLKGKSSYDKFIPNVILASGREVIQNFVGAYWSCDGMIEVRDTRTRGSRYRASATTVSQKLARDLQHALSRIGIRSNLRRKERKLETKAQPGGVYCSFNIEINHEEDTAKFKDMPGLCERKNKFAALCKKSRFITTLNEDPIVLIEDAGIRECMCVSVQEDHSLIWDDIVVHNTMKSLLVNVFWPAWEWTQAPDTRYLCTSHSQNLAVRDSTKMRRLITSDWYQTRWGDTVKLTGDQNAKTKFENSATGFREAVAFQSLTGVRADRVTIDDPHSVDSAMSDIQRQSTIETFLEAVPTRLTNPKKSAIIVIMQRLHTDDVSGVILEKNLGYEHIMLPMEFDPDRRCVTSLGFEDPRTKEGELLFPARFPEEVVKRDKEVMGPWASAGQFQQAPTPRGGGIIKRSYWSLWDDEEAKAQGLGDANKYPPMDYIVASLDPAYTEKKENDPSALTIWGVWQKGGGSARRLLSRNSEVSTLLDDRDTVPCVMLMHAWEKRLPIHGQEVFRQEGESERAFKARRLDNFGLVEHVIETCNKYNVDMLLIEAKASGLSVAQEIKRLNRTSTWGVYLVNPGNMDKVARMYAVQPIFASGAVYAPDKEWADKVITQAETFPKAKHDDLCLVGETLITLANGDECRLDEIKIGDQVKTPLGPRQVLSSQQTGIKPVWRLEHEAGFLEGTGDHPIFVNGGWIELANLQIGDMLATSNPLREKTSWGLKQKTGLWLKSFGLMGVITAVTQNLQIRLIEGILAGQEAAYTGTFGNSTMGQYQMGITFTTLMKTPRTMIFQIWNALKLRSIEKNTGMNWLHEANLRNDYAIWPKSEKRQRNGIEVLKDENGIKNMLQFPYINPEVQNPSAKVGMMGYVNGVVQGLWQKVLESRFAELLVKQQNQDTSLVKAVTFTHTMRPVFDLTIEDAHCYYANGILVHNCDATSQALKYLRERNFLRRPEEISQDIKHSFQGHRKLVPVYDV